MSAALPAPIRGPGAPEAGMSGSYRIASIPADGSPACATRCLRRPAPPPCPASATPRRALCGALRVGLAQRASECVVVERADDRKRLRLAEHGRGYFPHLVVSDSLYFGQNVVDRFEERVDELRLAEPAHPRGRVFQSEDDGATQLAFAAVELLVGQPGLDHLG